jgi:hypothetical protein
VQRLVPRDGLRVLAAEEGEVVMDQPFYFQLVKEIDNISIYRVPVFDDAVFAQLPAMQFHFFAIVWDEDRDTRVFSRIDAVYRAKLLPCCDSFGECKGTIQISLSDTVNAVGIAHYVAVKKALRTIMDYAPPDGDCWNVIFRPQDHDRAHREAFEELLSLRNDPEKSIIGAASAAQDTYAAALTKAQMQAAQDTRPEVEKLMDWLNEDDDE